jgi:peptide/nickel transport system substrate-binding protein
MGSALTRRGWLASAAAAALSGCAPRPAATPRASARPGQCIDASLQDAVNLNPLLYLNSGAETQVEYSVFDALWKIDPSGAFVPNLAVEIPTLANGGVSPDGLDWTIKLRPGVVWHDGAPFTARDVAFTLKTIRDPAIAVRSRNGHDHVEAISTPDDLTVKIRLKSPFAPYLVSWQKTSIVPEHILAQEPDLSVAPFNSSPIGTGPFKFKNRVSGDHIEFVANEAYHGGRPKLTSLIQKVVPDQQTLFAQFQTGEITILDGKGIPAELFARAKALPGTKVILAPSPYVEFFYFNLGKRQFADKRVRQALYRAIDRAGWTDVLYYGLPEPTLSYLPASHWAYNHALKSPPFDPAGAARLLDEAGWRVGADGVRAKDGVRLAFTNTTSTGDRSRLQAQQLIQQGFKAINVEMTIHNLPSAVVWGDFTSRSQFDTLLVGWDPVLYPDPDYTDRVASHRIPARNGAGSNYAQYSNPEVDALCARGVAELDRQARRRIYARLQEILLDELPFAPIFSYRSALGVSERLTGFAPNSYTPCNSWNNADWSVN